jgi:hypothetical protein
MALEDATNPMQGVSGPGPYAKRTDLQYSPDTYGAGVEMAAQKAGAPLAKTGGVKLSQAPTVPNGAASTAPANVGLYDRTQRPDEPVTHGIDIGPGAGSEALMMKDNVQSQYENAYQLFTNLAANPNASPTLKYLAQRIQQGF